MEIILFIFKLYSNLPTGGFLRQLIVVKFEIIVMNAGVFQRAKRSELEDRVKCILENEMLKSTQNFKVFEQNEKWQP